MQQIVHELIDMTELILTASVHDLQLTIVIEERLEIVVDL